MHIRELPSTQDRLVLLITYDAIKPIDLFPYFSTSEGLTKWWPQEAEVNLKMGGAYTLRWPTMDWILSGVYKAIEPGKVLMFTWAWAHEPDLPTRDVSLIFSQTGEDTELILMHGFYIASKEEQEDRKSHLEGWTHFLGQLEGVLKNK